MELPKADFSDTVTLQRTGAVETLDALYQVAQEPNGNHWMRRIILPPTEIQAMASMLGIRLCTKTRSKNMKLFWPIYVRPAWSWSWVFGGFLRIGRTQRTWPETLRVRRDDCQILPEPIGRAIYKYLSRWSEYEEVRGICAKLQCRVVDAIARRGDGEWMTFHWEETLPVVRRKAELEIEMVSLMAEIERWRTGRDVYDLAGALRTGRLNNQDG